MIYPHISLLELSFRTIILARVTLYHTHGLTHTLGFFWGVKLSLSFHSCGFTSRKLKQHESSRPRKERRGHSCASDPEPHARKRPQKRPPPPPSLWSHFEKIRKNTYLRFVRKNFYLHFVKKKHLSALRKNAYLHFEKSPICTSFRKNIHLHLKKTSICTSKKHPAALRKNVYLHFVKHLLSPAVRPARCGRRCNRAIPFTLLKRATIEVAFVLGVIFVFLNDGTP